MQCKHLPKTLFLYFLAEYPVACCGDFYFCGAVVYFWYMTETGFDFEKDQAEHNRETPSIQDTNFMQRDLIMRSGKNALEWIKEQSNKFRQLVNARPELFCGYVELAEEEKAQRLELVEAELNSVGREAA